MPKKRFPPRVAFHFIKKDFYLEDRSNLKEFIVELFKKEKFRLISLDYIFCSDDYLLSINRNFLKHDYFTDIISFDLSVKKEGLTGEIYISIDRVRENAIYYKNSFKMELHRVIFHGALHLCGYQDKTTHQTREMRGQENKYLSLYFRT